MCGIAGIVRWGGSCISDVEIGGMIHAVKHRGPDGQGVFSRDTVALAHRRLSIIDLATGQQPLCNEDGTIWVTFNGEIYNYLDLKQQLIAKGHEFKSKSDTEIIVHAYEEWGIECVKLFRGMFAFGLADYKAQKMFLVRDHFGIKPLYYRTGSNYFAFGSELSVLRAVHAKPPAGNIQAIDLFLKYQYVPTPLTVYKDVFKLPPGSYLSVSFDGSHTEPVRYWTFEFQPDYSITNDEWEEQACAVIRESVKAHLVSDVPFGVLLSGGLDSTLVALEMSQLLSGNVHAFTVGFDEKQYSEVSYAAEAAEKCGIQLHSKCIQSDSLDILHDLVSHYGEPFGDSSAIPTWHVSRLARSYVPMVLSGDGGDEAFGGYDSYEAWMQPTRWTTLIRHALRMAIGIRPRRSYHFLRTALSNYRTVRSPHRLSEWEQRITYVPRELRNKLWHREFQGVIADTCHQFEIAAAGAQNFDRLAYAQYIDYQTYLPNAILTKVDVASMYHGLEVRTPLIDLRVVELATRLPPQHRLASDKSGFVKKPLLKSLLRRKFTAAFVDRPKQGFALPRALWFLPGAHGRKFLEEMLYDSQSRLDDWFSREQIRVECDRHTIDYDNSPTLWLLLILAIWRQQNNDIEFS